MCIFYSGKELFFYCSPISIYVTVECFLLGIPVSRLLYYKRVHHEWVADNDVENCYYEFPRRRSIFLNPARDQEEKEGWPRILRNYIVDSEADSSKWDISQSLL